MAAIRNDAILAGLEAAQRLADRLAATQTRIVFAESCTAGLASALLAQIPGISAWHCGSAVTYRETTKIAWLNVSAEDIERHTAVSEQVAKQMAAGVLGNTPEAQLALSTTGHLGPNAPPSFDGLAFVGIARRAAGDHAASAIQLGTCHRLQLKEQERIARGWEAATAVLQLAALEVG